MVGGAALGTRGRVRVPKTKGDVGENDRVKHRAPLRGKVFQRECRFRNVLVPSSVEFAPLRRSFDFLFKKYYEKNDKEEGL